MEASLLHRTNGFQWFADCRRNAQTSSRTIPQP